MPNLTDVGVAALLELYEARDVSPVDVVDACLAKIADLDSDVNATITVCTESAERVARESARRWAKGRPRPLEGIPFGLKDVIATAGIRTTGGSGIYRDNVPTRDAAVAHLLAEAGGVLLAKLQTFSFALGGPANDDFGPTRNPWDLERTSGGSSSGPAAALAARMLPLAIGTDTGGSIRLPAAFCGVTGLRPTYGRVPRDGVMLLSWTLDTVGPMARSAGDCALVLPIITRRDYTGSTPQMPAAPSRVRASEPESLSGLRIGVPRDAFLAPRDGEIASAVGAAVDVLSDLGALPVDVELPHAYLADSIGRTIVSAEAASLHEVTLSRIHEYDRRLAERFLAARSIAAVDYIRSLRLQTLVREDFAAAFSRVDAIVMPTSATGPPELESEMVEVGDEAVEWRGLATLLTFPASLAGLPAVSTPSGLTSRRLPIGLQIVAPPLRDELCLAIASAHASAVGDAVGPPPLI